MSIIEETGEEAILKVYSLKKKIKPENKSRKKIVIKYFTYFGLPENHLNFFFLMHILTIEKFINPNKK